MKPLVSIVVPMFNAERFIHQCLYSCINQTMTDFEVVVVDDKSTDDCMDYVLDYSAKDNRIRYIRHDVNKGTAAARNTGICAANGDYIALLDADDMLTEDSLSARVSILNKFNEVQIVGGYTYVVSGDESTKKLKSRLADLRIRQGKFMQTSAAMLRKGVFMNSGMFNEELRLNEDREFWGRVLVNNKLLAVRIARPIAFYRLHENSKISIADPIKRDDELKKAVNSGPIIDITEPIHLINARNLY